MTAARLSKHKTQTEMSCVYVSLRYLPSAPSASPHPLSAEAFPKGSLRWQETPWMTSFERREGLVLPAAGVLCSLNSSREFGDYAAAAAAAAVVWHQRCITKGCSYS
ncbi:hypothetical protein MUK42_04272 [Musa troglodytarum]|uniref:Uncharacterized protein n=1 Tax=Musa troglodytarum TaxID=320322 RepID=A0A9E7GH61_9LILI|nr:hypothetical protein MUK42_04272 [Musa troglodytarum]